VGAFIPSGAKAQDLETGMRRGLSRALFLKSCPFEARGSRGLGIRARAPVFWEGVEPRGLGIAVRAAEVEPFQ
jgi:hypothetical protein